MFEKWKKALEWWLVDVVMYWCRFMGLDMESFKAVKERLPLVEERRESEGQGSRRVGSGWV